MFVITNIHQNYYKDRTYLCFDANCESQYYFGLDFKKVYIFDSREEAKEVWDKISPRVAFYKPSDTVMLEYINLQPDDFLYC